MSRYYHGITIIKLTFMSCWFFSCAMTLKKGRASVYVSKGTILTFLRLLRDILSVLKSGINLFLFSLHSSFLFSLTVETSRDISSPHSYDWMRWWSCWMSKTEKSFLLLHIIVTSSFYGLIGILRLTFFFGFFIFISSFFSNTLKKSFVALHSSVLVEVLWENKFIEWRMNLY